MLKMCIIFLLWYKMFDVWTLMKHHPPLRFFVNIILNFVLQLIFYYLKYHLLITLETIIYLHHYFSSQNIVYIKKNISFEEVLFFSAILSNRNTVQSIMFAHYLGLQSSITTKCYNSVHCLIIRLNLKTNYLMQGRV